MHVRSLQTTVTANYQQKLKLLRYLF